MTKVFGRSADDAAIMPGLNANTTNDAVARRGPNSQRIASQNVA